jgi:hypothetical protein
VAEDHRDDPRLAPAVPRQRLGHLLAPAVIRRDEIGADQEQHDVGRGQVPVDLGPPGSAGLELAIVPLGDQPAPLQDGQMGLELEPEVLVLVPYE